MRTKINNTHMAYPQHPNKHSYESLFTAKNFIDYSKKHKPDKYTGIPKTLIVTWQSVVEKSFKQKEKGKYSRNLFIKSQRLYTVNKNFGLLYLTGIGAPNVVTYLEEFIAAGTKKVICIGTAGGLQHPGVFIAKQAIRDEGTSHHYMAPGKYSVPDLKLTRDLAKFLKNREIDNEFGTTWTIDAPYRETKKEISFYKKQGVATVEMEASAIFAVCKLRKIPVASILVVSDILGSEKWDPKFHTFDVNKKLRDVTKIICDYCNNKNIK